MRKVTSWDAQFDGRFMVARGTVLSLQVVRPLPQRFAAAAGVQLRWQQQYLRACRFTAGRRGTH